MKLQPDLSPNLNIISACGQGYVAINGVRLESSVLFAAHEPCKPWPVASIDQLTADSFSSLLAWDIELVILGTGNRHHFPKPQLLRLLYEKRIGVESMDTAAACRTFNILAGEGRKVAAALIVET
jgi:uncharacterized protein